MHVAVAAERFMIRHSRLRPSIPVTTHSAEGEAERVARAAHAGVLAPQRGHGTVLPEPDQRGERGEVALNAADRGRQIARERREKRGRLG